jgi:hypothetical protein
MSSGFLFDALERQRDDTPGADIWRGNVADTVTAVTDRLMVIIPDFAGDLQFGPCRWTPRLEPVTVNLAEPGETARNTILAHIIYPQKGDDCLVAFDQNSEPWVIAYAG